MVGETIESKTPAARSRFRFFPGMLKWTAFAVFVLLGCEIGSRSDDLFFDGMPLLANPTYESLFERDQSGLKRGRPGARWKKVVLNNLGMRGPDVLPHRQPGCARWLFLGASETFGEPSLADAEYPAKLRKLVGKDHCVEVLNAAYPGIAPQKLLTYYRAALAQLSPDIVFIYPSTHFYLAETLPRPVQSAETTHKQAKVPPVTESSFTVLLGKSRFLERLRDAAEIPAPIQRWRLRNWVAEAGKDKSQDWYFSSVPGERLELLAADSKLLLEEVRSSGAKPVLLTHAVRVSNPPSGADHDDLFAMQVYVPRARDEILAAFEYSAAEVVRTVGAEAQVSVIDVAAALSGRRDRFVDLVHFSPQGHEDVAKLIAQSMAGDLKK